MTNNYIVLAAIDLQHADADKMTVDEAVLLAKAHNGEVHIHVVIPDAQNEYVQAYVPADMKAKVEQDANADLKVFADGVVGKKVSWRGHVTRGIVYTEVLELAKKINAAVVVIGAHRPGFFDFRLGPNAARVARGATCNVLIVRPE
jgi:nucleotide-binding universal stress UspA family protein